MCFLTFNQDKPKQEITCTATELLLYKTEAAEILFGFDNINMLIPAGIARVDY
jgi:hypothetical protein